MGSRHTASLKLPEIPELERGPWSQLVEDPGVFWYTSYLEEEVSHCAKNSLLLHALEVSYLHEQHTS